MGKVPYSQGTTSRKVRCLMENPEIQERLDAIPHEIWQAAEEAIDAESALNKAKAELENEYDKKYLEYKSVNETSTVKELECMARSSCHTMRMLVIVREASAKSKRNLHEKLKTEFGALQSMIKLRVEELRTLGG